MTKKFVSLVLSLALVIGLVPMMSVSVSAAGETSITVDDFESYEVGDGADSAGVVTSLSVDGVEKWRISKLNNIQIVSMTGYDGKPTKALKYSNNKVASVAYNKDSYRLKAQPQSSYNNLKGKLYVQEYKIYLPADVKSDGVTDYKKPKEIIMGYHTAIKSGNDLYISKTSTGYKIPDNQWVKITVVADYTNWLAKYDPVTYVIYADDKPVKYIANDINAICEPGTNTTNAYWFISDGYDETDVHDQHFFIDDVNMYTNPDKTTASSVYSDASNVSSKVSPVVNFTEKLFDTTIHSDGIISKDNIEFYKSADSSAAVEIKEPVVSDDDKSITIDPEDELVGGVEYTVVVKNLKDMYGRSIDPYTFSFTTAQASSITASQPVFTKENLFVAGGASQNLTSLENGYIKASSTVSNSANTAKEVMVLAMLKDGNDIKYFQFKNITVPANGSATFSSGFQVDNASTQKIETVVWDSIYNKTPLADKYAFSSSGLVKTALEDLLGE